MNYIEVAIEIPVDKKYLSEILMAFLAEVGFESFSEENNILLAYISENLYNPVEVREIIENYGLRYFAQTILQKNWNEEWEKNFNPIVIEDILTIKAPFHNENLRTRHTVVIEPKMSFGTGHHATTYMMCKLIHEYDFSGSNVLDMGCGTGILAIYASLKGAKKVTAIDIDEWAYENTVENAGRNNINNIISIKGDVADIPKETYNFILANINLNILKKDIPKYIEHMEKGALLFLSGFFASEFVQIEKICNLNNAIHIKSIERENWIACIFKKD